MGKGCKKKKLRFRGGHITTQTPQPKEAPAPLPTSKADTLTNFSTGGHSAGVCEHIHTFETKQRLGFNLVYLLCSDILRECIPLSFLSVFTPPNLSDHRENTSVMSPSASPQAALRHTTTAEGATSTTQGTPTHAAARAQRAVAAASLPTRRGLLGVRVRVGRARAAQVGRGRRRAVVERAEGVVVVVARVEEGEGVVVVVVVAAREAQEASTAAALKGIRREVEVVAHRPQESFRTTKGPVVGVVRAAVVGRATATTTVVAVPATVALARM